MDDEFVPISSGDFLKPDDSRAIRGGGTRLVPYVPIGQGKFLPCIWKSREVCLEDINGDGQKLPAYECLLLLSRKPLQTIRAVVDVKAWEHYQSGPVEW